MTNMGEKEIKVWCKRCGKIDVIGVEEGLVNWTRTISYSKVREDFYCDYCKFQKSEVIVKKIRRKNIEKMRKILNID